MVSLSFWERLPCSRIQETSSIYCVLITMVSEHNKALSPCIHLCFWECRGFGNCTGPTQRHPLFWRQRDEPALSTGEEAGRKSCYCELDIKKKHGKKVLLHRQCCRVGKGGWLGQGTCGTGGCPGGARHPQPRWQLCSYLLHHPKTIQTPS